MTEGMLQKRKKRGLTLRLRRERDFVREGTGMGEHGGERVRDKFRKEVQELLVIGDTGAL